MGDPDADRVRTADDAGRPADLGIERVTITPARSGQATRGRVTEANDG
jgi:hypothetical protein